MFDKVNIRLIGYLFLETMKHDKYVVISWKIGMTE